MIRVALHHKSTYQYDRPVGLGPQVVRLRPAPHCRTPISAYALKVTPAEHYLNWQQDPHSNYLARLVFNGSTRAFDVEVNLIANMTVINPFDFFLEPSASAFPFTYESSLAKDLLPFFEPLPAGPALTSLLASVDRSVAPTNDFLVSLNQQIQKRVEYLIRLEPGVQTPEETLTLGSGSCRDSAWLLVQVLRHLGLASRFVSGYLIQLKPDVESLDGPSRRGRGFHRPARLDRSFLARCRLDWFGPDLGPIRRRGAHPAGLHAGANVPPPPSRGRLARRKSTFNTSCR